MRTLDQAHAYMHGCIPMKREKIAQAQRTDESTVMCVVGQAAKESTDRVNAWLEDSVQVARIQQSVHDKEERLRQRMASRFT
jgi:hypothetical protein